MTDECARLVLRNNYLQSLALSLAERQGAALNAEMVDLMRAMEAEGRLDRAVEYLPSNREVAERTAKGLGLTRPELAVLLAYAKLSLYDHLLASDVPDDPYLGFELRRYFPKPVQDQFPDAIEKHRLRREIVATQLANAVINRCGPGIVTRLQGRTGRSVADIVRAYALARDVFGILDVNNAIDALDTKIGGARQLELYAGVGDHTAERMLWFLRNVDFAPGLEALAKRFGGAVSGVAKDAKALFAPEALAIRQERLEAYKADRVPVALAERIVDIPALGMALDGALVAERTKASVTDAVRTLFALGDEFDLAVSRMTLRTCARPIRSSALPSTRAAAASEEALRRIAVEVLKNGKGWHRRMDRAEGHSRGERQAHHPRFARGPAQPGEADRFGRAARRSGAGVSPLTQCRKWRVPVKTMARPALFAASITS